jgi:hypothetical protein
MADQDAAFVMLDRDGTVLLATGPVGPKDARLRRAQPAERDVELSLRSARIRIAAWLPLSVWRRLRRLPFAGGATVRIRGIGARWRNSPASRAQSRPNRRISFHKQGGHYLGEPLILAGAHCEVAVVTTPIACDQCVAMRKKCSVELACCERANR